MKHLTFILIASTMILSQIAFGQNNTYTGTDAGNGASGGSLNVMYGYKAGDKVTGNYNALLGAHAGSASNNTGTGNVFIGYTSGFSNTSGANNSFTGYASGQMNTTGWQNTFSGYYAGFLNTTGGNNLMMGSTAGYSNTTGNYNVYLGKFAGYSGNGSSNVFIGNSAGYYETGSNKLYISNSNTTTPLIYGDFLAGKVGINVLPGAFNLNVGGTINATALYVNGQPVSLGGGGVNPWSTNGTAINYNLGNVGIGIMDNNPAYKLHVGGTVNASEFRVNGNPLPWNQNGSTISYMTGSVGIGTTTPTTYKLAVNGTIGSKEVKVENTSGAWPDYVFEPEYSLPSLKDVETFIKQNKHLPGVPSQQDIARDGHALGETDLVLLKKVEELTLYMIEQGKQLELMRALHEEQSKQLKETQALNREQAAQLKKLQERLERGN